MTFRVGDSVVVRPGYAFYEGLHGVVTESRLDMLSVRWHGFVADRWVYPAHLEYAPSVGLEAFTLEEITEYDQRR